MPQWQIRIKIQFFTILPQRRFSKTRTRLKWISKTP